MEVVENPDIRVFASEAKTGEILKFPDVLRGWGITLDQTQGKPPLEWMNDAFNRIDLNNLYLLQQGIPEWDKAVRYPINSIIKHAGKIYLCVAENENNEPSVNSDKWSLYVKNATTTQRGIVQLTDTIDDSEDKAITPRAAKDAFSSQIGVGQEWQRVTRVSGATNTNTTKKPILLQSVAYTGSLLSVEVDGHVVARTRTEVREGHSDSTLSAIIPPGSSYKITWSKSAGGAVDPYFMELR